MADNNIAIPCDLDKPANDEGRLLSRRDEATKRRIEAAKARKLSDGVSMAETMELEPFPPISTSPESTPASQRRSSGRSSPQIRVTAIDDEESELFRELHEVRSKENHAPTR